MSRITVATVCLNAAMTIEHTIASVMAAGDSFAQYVVVDGGSTDGTLTVIDRFKPKLGDRLTLVSEPDDGLYFAMNRALELATGDYILYLGADDTLEPDALRAVLTALDGAGEVGLVYGDVAVVEPNGSTRHEAACTTPKMIGRIPRAMPACHQATLFRVADLREAGGFDTSFHIAADYELYLRFLELGRESLYVPVTIARFSLAGVSATNAKATAEEYRRAWVKHGVSPAMARVRVGRSRFNWYVSRMMRRARG